VVVAGNGVLGQSLALTLARRGLRVALLGHPDRPWAASAAAGAMLGCFGEVTEALVSSEYGRTKLDLDVQAKKLWPTWSEELAAESGQGNVQVANGTTVILNAVGVRGIDDVNYVAIKEELRRYGEPFEDVEPADIEWLDPDPGSRPQSAFHIPGEHAVNAAMLLEELAQAYVHAGGTVIAEPAARVEYSHGRVTGVVLASGARLAAGHVVLAAGARSQHSPAHQRIRPFAAGADRGWDDAVLGDQDPEPLIRLRPARTAPLRRRCLHRRDQHHLTGAGGTARHGRPPIPDRMWPAAGQAQPLQQRAAQGPGG
jgi:glycine/D-amino acid oxidase-like deaminating enzyme